MQIENLYRVSSIDEALQHLHKYGKRAQIAAGCTDLLVHIREEKNTSADIIDISSVEALKKIDIHDEYVTLGAMVTFSDIVALDEIKFRFEGLWEACQSVGSPQIRNAGTLGGNIANGSPAADSAPPLLALNATVILQSVNGKRQVPLDKFYTGKGQVDMKSDEMITFLRFESGKEKRGLISFEKLGLRNALAISRISVSVYAELDEEKVITKCRIGSGSIGLTPGRELEIEGFLTGKRLERSILNEAAHQFELEIERRLKGRSSMPFKKQAIRGVIKAALEKIIDQDRRRSDADVQS